MINFSNHAFKELDNDFASAHEMVQQMAALIADQLTMLEVALVQNLEDNSKAKLLDKKVNALEIDIEKQVASIFSKYTLVGDELRFTMTLLKLSSTLERMGDMAKNCVKRVVKLSKPVQPEFIKEATESKKLIEQMLLTSIELVKHYDEQKAKTLLAQEDEVGGLYKKIQLLLKQDMADNERVLESAHMLFIMKNLERMADYALDIVKLCYYIHHGKKFEKPE